MQLSRPSKYLIAFAVLIVLLAFGYHRYSLHQFSKAYAVYAGAASAHDEAAYIPALPDNPLRRDLNRALSDSLNEELSPSERISRAREGLTLLVLAEGNIDAIGELGKETGQALEVLDAQAQNYANLTARDDMREIVTLARRRSEVISDVRGLSYRANHHTKEIFDQIIRDEGVLTDAHVDTLNRLIPSVEEQFDTRSNLYIELQALAGDITQAFGRVRKAI